LILQEKAEKHGRNAGHHHGYTADYRSAKYEREGKIERAHSKTQGRYCQKQRSINEKSDACQDEARARERVSDRK
jgi:hypothetical protein